jgi:hypothetical protein
MVHLIGHYLKPSPPVKAVLDWLPERSRTPRKALKRNISPGVPYRGRLGNGVVQAAVINALASADGPLRRSEIHAIVAERLGRPVSMESVSFVLRSGVRGEQRRFERATYGYYRTLPPT